MCVCVCGEDFRLIAVASIVLCGCIKRAPKIIAKDNGAGSRIKRLMPDAAYAAYTQYVCAGTCLPSTHTLSLSLPSLSALHSCTFSIIIINRLQMLSVYLSFFPPRPPSLFLLHCLLRQLCPHFGELPTHLSDALDACAISWPFALHCPCAFCLSLLLLLPLFFLLLL